MRLSLSTVLACLLIAPAVLTLSALLLPAFSESSFIAQAEPEKTGAAPASNSSPAEEGKKAAPSSPKEPAASPTKTPLDELRDYTLAMIDGMNEKQLQYIYVIQNRYGIVRAVDIVRRDVGKAVDLCGKAHADKKGALDARYKRWTDNVSPILEDAQNLLERDIVKQSFVKPEKVRKLLDLYKKAGDFTDSRTEKTVLTTPEACDFLLKNMDITQKDLPDLLRASLKSLTVPDPAPEPGNATPPASAQPSDTPADSLNK